MGCKRELSEIISGHQRAAAPRKVTLWCTPLRCRTPTSPSMTTGSSRAAFDFLYKVCTAEKKQLKRLSQNSSFPVSHRIQDFVAPQSALKKKTFGSLLRTSLCAPRRAIHNAKHSFKAPPKLFLHTYFLEAVYSRLAFTFWPNS